MRAHDEGEWVAECRCERVGRAVEDCSYAAARNRSHIKSLGAPVSAASEGRVALKVDGDVARCCVVAKAGKRMRVCIGIGLRQWAAVPEDQTPV